MLCEPCIEHPLELETKILTSNQIINIVCEEYGFSPSLALGKFRWAKLVECRMVISHILRNDRHLDMSLKSIGFMLGRRDHTTIIHSIRTIENQIEVDEVFREKLINIYLKVYGTTKYFI